MSDYQESIGQRTKEAVIKVLQHYFQVTSLMGTPNEVIKVPVIREAYSNNVRSYPAIFLKILSNRPVPLGINQGFVADVWSDDQVSYQQYLPGTENDRNPIPYRRRVIAERYGYMADITFSLQVWGDTTYVRNRVVDETIAAFARFEKEALLEQGIVIVSISEGEESDFPLNDTDQIFVANLTLVINAELYFDYPVASITGISVMQKTIPNPSPDQPNYILGNGEIDV